MPPRSLNIKVSVLLLLPITNTINILLYTANTQSFVEIHYMLDQI